MVFAGGKVPPKGGAPCGRYQLIWVQNITWSDSSSLSASSKYHLRREKSNKQQHFSAAKRPAQPAGACKYLQDEWQDRFATMVLKFPVLPFYIFNLINKNMKIKNVRLIRLLLISAEY